MDNKMIILPESKRSQTTIFIIIAIVIVAVILLFFLLREDVGPDIPDKPVEAPESFLDACLKEPIYGAINLISEQGGYRDPQLYKVFAFEGEPPKTIGYLCYQSNYYLNCVNQEPMLLNHLKGEIGDHIREEVRECWDQLGEDLEKQGYVVDARYKGFEVVLKTENIMVEINGELTLTKSGETSRETGFKAIALSRFYGIASLAQEIVSQEATYGSFSTGGYNYLYPEGFETSSLETPDNDGTEIYTIKDRATQERFRFAVRGGVRPAGLG